MQTKAQTWMLAAFEWGKTAQDWTIITRKSPNFIEWQKYFQNLGFSPWAFRRLEKGETEEWTAPCQWPVWFPADWDQPKQLERPKPRLIEKVEIP